MTLLLTSVAPAASADDRAVGTIDATAAPLDCWDIATAPTGVADDLSFISQSSFPRILHSEMGKLAVEIPFPASFHLQTSSNFPDNTVRV